MNDINDFYKKNPHVVISDRKFASSIDIDAYKYVNHKRMVGIAIVTSKENASEDLIKEQEMFKSLEEAKDWAASFVAYAVK